MSLKKTENNEFWNNFSRIEKTFYINTALSLIFHLFWFKNIGSDCLIKLLDHIIMEIWPLNNNLFTYCVIYYDKNKNILFTLSWKHSDIRRYWCGRLLCCFLRTIKYHQKIFLILLTCSVLFILKGNYTLNYVYFEKEFSIMSFKLHKVLKFTYNYFGLRWII